MLFLNLFCDPLPSQPSSGAFISSRYFLFGKALFKPDNLSPHPVPPLLFRLLRSDTPGPFDSPKPTKTKPTKKTNPKPSLSRQEQNLLSSTLICLELLLSPMKPASLFHVEDPPPSLGHVPPFLTPPVNVYQLEFCSPPSLFPSPGIPPPRSFFFFLSSSQGQNVFRRFFRHVSLWRL